MEFYYPNWINDHWRIQGLVFFGDAAHFIDAAHGKTFLVEDIKAHCVERGIAYFDTATAVNRLRDNASDKHLEIVEHTDIVNLITPLKDLRAIVTTGEKATEAACRQLGLESIPGVNEAKIIRFDDAKAMRFNEAIPIPNTSLELYRLPSSSRAYPLSLEKKAASYRQMFLRYGLL